MKWIQRHVNLEKHDVNALCTVAPYPEGTASCRTWKLLTGEVTEKNKKTKQLSASIATYAREVERYVRWCQETSPSSFLLTREKVMGGRFLLLDEPILGDFS